MWPRHCVARTKGARFHPRLKVPKGAIIVSKATRRNLEAYSGFQGTDLEGRLKEFGVRELYVGGLATDYCVKQTVLDALRAGFEAYIKTDCIKGVNVRKDDSSAALRLVAKRGARPINSVVAARRSRRAA